MDKFHFNKAIARIRELTNALDLLTKRDKGASWVYTFGIKTVVRLIAPIIPHIAEEMWRELGHKTLVVDGAWPDYDERLLIKNTVTVGVQVNGKMRGTVQLPADCDQAMAEGAGLKIGPVIKAIGESKIQKIIFVPNRILNIVL